MGPWTTIEVVETEPHVRTIALNRPAQRNALCAQLSEELLACLDALAADPDVRAVVLAGRGPVFCAGADLAERLSGGPEQAVRQREALLRVIERIDALPVPVIAMIHGAAIAGGLELALACDLRVASESAKLALPEARRVGVFPGGGAPVRLPKMIGRGRASLVVFTGRRFSAREAFELGFVECVVPDDALERETRAIARDIAAGSPAGIRAAKQLIRRSVDLDTDGANALSRALRDPLDFTDDAREGIAAWREKRAPKFTGR